MKENPASLHLVLSSADVQSRMHRIEPQESYSALIADELSQTVFGQPDATKAVARRIALFDTGLSDSKHPLGSMVFLGPSGVGKTEMSHAAAKQMFGDTHSDRLRIINMAEMTAEHDTKRFVGSPPSYVGYGEKPAIPHDWLHAGRSIIVLDEFEKAHPSVRQLFLGALDKGSMDARNGAAGSQPLDFRQTLFIFTSNIGGQEMHNVNAGTGSIGFRSAELSHTDKNKRIQSIAEKGVKDTLSPEFINRIDDIVVFHEITDPEIHARIFDKFVNYRNHDLREMSGTSVRPNPQTGQMERVSQAPQFYVTTEFKEHILDTAGNKGGREMKRELEKQLFEKAADVFMGLDVSTLPLIADYDPDIGETVFYTDTEPPKAEAKKKESSSQPIAQLPKPKSGDQDTTGSSKPAGDSGSSGKQPGTETPPLEGKAGEEPKKPDEPPETGGEPPNGPIDYDQRDMGDEIDDIAADGNNFPFIPDQEGNEPPGNGLKVGVRIVLWDESMVKDDGNVTSVSFEIRDIKLPD